MKPVFSLALATSTLLAAPAGAVERCFDELGHRIPGACSDQEAAPKPAGSVSDSDSPGHHGFFLRMTLGGGATNFETDGDLKVGKGGGNFDIAVGGAPFDDFAIYGFALGNTIVGPTLESNGQTIETSDEISFNTSIVGAGITYYFPWNVYADIGAGVAVLSLAYDDRDSLDRVTYESDPGVGLVVCVGKEWMVSESWGLGAAIKAIGTKVADGPANDRTEFSGLSVLAAFSATFF
jgi:hypothetical protein